ncbi:MAG: Holliday junction resolvase RuvX [Planctomycetes bacterium]|nr:Holliday junction resolvase RuvX [Planctomycetota bacterium]
MPFWIGIDHGAKRIGVAVGNTDTSIASPVQVVTATPPQQALERIATLAADHQAVGIVVGWPRNMDDSEGPQSRAARDLAWQLAELTDLDVRMWDERLSSFAADNALAGMLTRNKRRRVQDAVAAAHILQDFLSSDGPRTAPRPCDVA